MQCKLWVRLADGTLEQLRPDQVLLRRLDGVLEGVVAPVSVDAVLQLDDGKESDLMRGGFV